MPVVGYLILAPYLNGTADGHNECGNRWDHGIYLYGRTPPPLTEKYGKHHHAIVGLIVGMAVMAFSLILL